MTREKRNKIVFLIALFGIILLLIISVTIKINEYRHYKDSLQIKSNLLSVTKECIEDGKCSDTVTIKELIDLKYINKEDYSNYKDNSYIIYSIKGVFLNS